MSNDEQKIYLFDLINLVVQIPKVRSCLMQKGEEKLKRN